MRQSIRSGARPDYGLWAAAAGLALLSAIGMASAASTVDPRLAVRHVSWILAGIALSWAAARTDYRRWTDAAWLGYGLSLGILALVPVAGAMRLGATRWLSIFGFSVQPSEIMKVTTVCLLARYLSGQPAPLPPRALAVSLAITAPPALLIFLQPDLGSASVFAAIWLAAVWVAGISPRLLAGLAAAALALLPVGWHFLKDYQRDRLLVFVNPDADPLGAGYTIIQSKIAIGSGRLWGRGWFAGTQNQLSFLPERHSDFLFSVIGEEWGFLGSAAVVVLFAWLVGRALRVAMAASDPQGRLLIAGACAWLGYQAFVNMGMVMGLLPVVGVPLPLVSYGGTSMVMVWMMLGLVQSVRRSDARL
jgi:rod shape determining protein RodA